MTGFQIRTFGRRLVGVVHLLELDRAEVAEPLLDAPGVIEAVDVLEQREIRLGPGDEDSAADALRLDADRYLQYGPMLLLRGGFGRAAFCQVVDELTGCDVERRSPVHESQNTGIALPVFDDEAQDDPAGRTRLPPSLKRRTPVLGSAARIPRPGELRPHRSVGNLAGPDEPRGCVLLWRQ